MAWSKAFIKLLEVVENQLGRYSNPSLMLKNAQAEADAKRVLAQADRDVEDIKRGKITVLDTSKLKMNEIIKLGPEFNVEELTNEQRVIARMAHEEAIKDNNIQKVIAYAAEEILENSSEEIKEVDEDLIARIFEEIKFVNKKDLQKIWAGVLAKSILRPEGVSVDLIDFLRGLTNKRAEKIAQIGAHVFANRLVPDCQMFHDQGIGLWVQAEAWGLVSGATALGLTERVASAHEGKNKNQVRYGDKIVIWENEDPKSVFEIQCFCLLTELGVQVMELGSFSYDYKYFDQVVERMKNDNPNF